LEKEKFEEKDNSLPKKEKEARRTNPSLQWIRSRSPPTPREKKTKSRAIGHPYCSTLSRKRLLGRGVSSSSLKSSFLFGLFCLTEGPHGEKERKLKIVGYVEGFGEGAIS